MFLRLFFLLVNFVYCTLYKPGELISSFLGFFFFFLDSNSTAIFSPAVVSQHVGLQQQETLHCRDLAYCSYNLLLPLPIHSLPSELDIAYTQTALLKIICY